MSLGLIGNCCGPCNTPPPPPPDNADPGTQVGLTFFSCDYYVATAIGTPTINQRFYAPQNASWHESISRASPRNDDDYTLTLEPVQGGYITLQTNAKGKFFGTAGYTLLLDGVSYAPNATFQAAESATGDPPVAMVIPPPGSISSPIQTEGSGYVKLCRTHQNTASSLGGPRFIPTFTKKPNVLGGFDPAAPLAPSGLNQNYEIIPGNSITPGSSGVSGVVAVNFVRKLQIVDEWDDDMCETRDEHTTYKSIVSRQLLTSKHAGRILMTRRYAFEEMLWNGSPLRLDCSQPVLPVGNYYYATQYTASPVHTSFREASGGSFTLSTGFPTVAGRFYKLTGGVAYNGLLSDGPPVYSSDGWLSNLFYDSNNLLPLLAAAIPDGGVFMARMNFVYCGFTGATLTETPKLPNGDLVTPGSPISARSVLESCLTRLPSTQLMMFQGQQRRGYFHPQGAVFPWWCPGRSGPIPGPDPTQLPLDSSSLQMGNFDMQAIVGRWYNLYSFLGNPFVVGGVTYYDTFTKDNTLGHFIVGIQNHQPSLFGFAGNRLVQSAECPLIGRDVRDNYILLGGSDVYKVVIRVPEHSTYTGQLPSNSTVVSVAPIGNNENITAGPQEVVLLSPGGFVNRPGTVNYECGGNDVNIGDIYSGKAGLGTSLRYATTTGNVRASGPYINGSRDWLNGTGTDESDVDAETGTVDFAFASPPTIEQFQSMIAGPSITVYAISRLSDTGCVIILGGWEKDISFEIRRYIPAQPWESLPVVATVQNGTLFNSIYWGCRYLDDSPTNGFYAVKAKNLSGVFGNPIYYIDSRYIYAPIEMVKPKLTFVANGLTGLPAPIFQSGVACVKETPLGGNELILRNAAGQILHTFTTEDVDYGFYHGDAVTTYREHITLASPNPTISDEEYMTFFSWIKDKRRVDGVPSQQPGNINLPYARLVRVDSRPTNGDYRIAAGTYEVEW